MNQKHDPLDLSAQERRRENQARKERLNRDAEGDDIKWLMSSKRGRRVAWRLLDQAGVFRSVFNTNAMQMAFAEGNRNTGLKLLSLIHALCPELFTTMTRENTNEHRNEDDGNPNDQ